MAGVATDPATPTTRRPRRATFFLRVTLPLAALAGLLLSVPLVHQGRAAEFYGLVLAYVLPPAGKETIIPAAIAAGFDPLLVATYVAGLDMTGAWFLAWNWDFAIHLPRVGPAVERLMDRGRKRLEGRALLDRSAFLGVALFVFVPVQGTGSLSGVVLGRMIGMPPQRAWVAIMIGALLSSFAWAYAADAIRSAVGAFGPAVVLQASVVIISSGVLLWLVTRRVARG